MDVHFLTANEDPKNAELLIVPVYTGTTFSEAGADLDSNEYSGLLSHTAKNTPSFSAKAGETTSLITPAGSKNKQIILLGMGNTRTSNEEKSAKIGKALQEALDNSGYKTATFLGSAPTAVTNFSPKVSAEISATIANYAFEADYSFSKYKSSPAPAGFTKLNVATSDQAAASAKFAHINAVTKGKNWAKDLGNEPPNTLYPESYAKEIEAKLNPLGITTRIIDAAEMEQLGMGAALAVGGSSRDRQPCMVVMEYDGTNDPQGKPVGLVGKGLTIDTGGYSLKTGGSMVGMKMDMCGSAAVVGTMQALAEQKSATKVVAIVGLAENKIAHDAMVCDDIIKSMAGKTIEVGNTDAEGRLVLADCMTYLQRNYSPHTMIDLATLTGACMVALGHDRAGFFTDTDSLVDEFNAAAKNTGELIWRLPMDQSHKDVMKGKNADLSNTGKGRFAGASTAAGFLSHFVEGNTKWAHIDIAGTAIPADGMASGYGVKLLVDWINNNYASASPKTAPTAKP
jgi:leucyl aminopeptidase